MMVWESGFDLMDWAIAVPETVGTQVDIVRTSATVEQEEYTPKPRCKAWGYHTLEWLEHWRKNIPETVGIVPPKIQWDIYMDMIEQFLAK
jgi:hypothetical protein